MSLGTTILVGVLLLQTVTAQTTSLSVKNVVVMPAGAVSRDAAIQPLPNTRRTFELGVAMPRTWKAGYGWQPTGLPAAYRFTETDLPAGYHQLIVATDVGDRRYTVRAADRSRMR